VSQPTDYYAILGVSPAADEDDIKRAYRALAKQHHPDRVPAERREWARAEMARINAAYEVLGNPLRRAQYHQRHGYRPVESPQGTAAAATNDSVGDRFGAKSAPTNDTGDCFGAKGAPRNDGCRFRRRGAAAQWATRRQAQREPERLRRGHTELRRIVALSSATLLGLVLMAALAWFRQPGPDGMTGRYAWAIVLAVGAFWVVAALWLTEL
jgi:curved DNA-binding protein CbpA